MDWKTPLWMALLLLVAMTTASAEDTASEEEKKEEDGSESNIQEMAVYAPQRISNVDASSSSSSSSEEKEENADETKSASQVKESAVLHVQEVHETKNEDHYDIPQAYKFGYEVKDEYHGHQFRHEQKDPKGTIHGRFGYRDNHGLYRQVDYVADDHGFRANVKTNEPGVENQDPADVEIQKNYDKTVAVVPVAERGSVEAIHVNAEESEKDPRYTPSSSSSSSSDSDDDSEKELEKEEQDGEESQNGEEQIPAQSTHPLHVHPREHHPVYYRQQAVSHLPPTHNEDSYRPQARRGSSAVVYRHFYKQHLTHHQHHIQHPSGREHKAPPRSILYQQLGREHLSKHHKIAPPPSYQHHPASTVDIQSKIQENDPDHSPSHQEAPRYHQQERVSFPDSQDLHSHPKKYTDVRLQQYDDAAQQEQHSDGPHKQYNVVPQQQYNDAQHQQEQYNHAQQQQYDDEQQQQYHDAQQKEYNPAHQQQQYHDAQQKEYNPAHQQQQYHDAQQKEYNPAHQQQQYDDDQEQQYHDVQQQQYNPAAHHQQYSAAPQQQQQYGTNPHEQYDGLHQQQYNEVPEQQYKEEPQQQYKEEHQQQYIEAAHKQYIEAPHKQYTETPHKQYTETPHKQYIEAPHKQYIEAPHKQYIEAPHKQYIETPHKQYIEAPHKQYIDAPIQQYNDVPHQSDRPVKHVAVYREESPHRLQQKQQVVLKVPLVRPHEAHIHPLNDPSNKHRVVIHELNQEQTPVAIPVGDPQSKYQTSYDPSPREHAVTGYKQQEKITRHLPVRAPVAYRLQPVAESPKSSGAPTYEQQEPIGYQQIELDPAIYHQLVDSEQHKGHKIVAIPVIQQLEDHRGQKLLLIEAHDPLKHQEQKTEVALQEVPVLVPAGQQLPDHHSHGKDPNVLLPQSFKKDNPIPYDPQSVRDSPPLQHYGHEKGLSASVGKSSYQPGLKASVYSSIRPIYAKNGDSSYRLQIQADPSAYASSQRSQDAFPALHTTPKTSEDDGSKSKWIPIPGPRPQRHSAGIQHYDVNENLRPAQVLSPLYSRAVALIFDDGHGRHSSGDYKSQVGHETHANYHPAADLRHVAHRRIEEAKIEPGQISYASSDNVANKKNCNCKLKDGKLVPKS